MLSLLAHSQEAVDAVAGSLEATDIGAVSEMWTSSVTAAAAAAAAACAQQTAWLIRLYGP